ncbi:MAG TPA: NADH-quinone oxidoreductase subunit C [Balneola sp.]|jgi:NADH-quinone oxidoreductase subunit C|nr:NADH-quinone oxidoreductase subunit C [Bacteroidota bacterium]MAC04029.1 NADH-quinone oxidoreductase subunit C [Balneola sp.]MAO78036.1 NADH-quinone oxidoreductase subunit C [Balneola sp.]MBF64037.1 NADH-quinone oxidoreductase subunit C [Balneola sp.]HAH50780.1 NADH-quinone oxidoreductase subunit C [Balneola sp.]|tara:strand:+ start:374 stop:886 length:513 start_codon:yes stop_codon:yes gene_type:complete
MSLDLNETLQAVVDGLSENFSDKLIEVYQSSGDTFIRVEADSILEISKYLKEKQHFVFLCDVFGNDRYTSDERFEVVYNLMNLRTQTRIFVKARVEEENPTIESVSSIWKAAGWNEREVYDMFGVRFENHPDLRRIFMPEDFEYFPMRKEFPLLGIPGSIELPNTTPDTE